MPTTPGPDFVLIGAPETATPLLRDALARHPQVHVALGPGDHERADTGQLVGEHAPHTLADAAGRAGLGATSKLVVVVRDPVDRAFAAWTRLRREGVEPEHDFVRAVRREDDPSFGYRSLGLYGEQLTDLFAHVDPRRALVLRHRDVLDHAELSLHRVCELLGIDTGLVPVAVGSEHHARPRPTAEQRAALLPLFSDDIERFARLVGQEFSEWLEHRAAPLHRASAG
ncbi:MAG: sulfotransferase [Marmoricola sp.]